MTDSKDSRKRVPVDNEERLAGGETRLRDALFPVGLLFSLILYGLVWRPVVAKSPALPLEIIFIFAAAMTVMHLLWLGHRWLDIQSTIVEKLSRAMPAFLILFCIGLVIASWIVCGTIPMLVFWGLKVINPAYLYVLAFLAPIVFSTLTGTSWGSVGTIGVVLIGIATALDANLGITAGAVIGGAYFGDKVSPLSDTTNLAALAADVDLFEHIHSMMYTTLPSALLAATAYFFLGFAYPPGVASGDLSAAQPYLEGLSSIFSFSVWLLLPPAIVLMGSFRKLPTVPVLVSSVLVACCLALVFQKFTLTDVVQSVYKGFDCSMAVWAGEIPEKITVLLNRGGLYALNDAIITAFMVFVFIGAMDHIRAMPTVVSWLLKPVKSANGTILSSLIATAATNAMTSNQFATSFIIGDAFKAKYDSMKVPRKVLSRSLEDTGTMIESIIPWTTSSLFMVATLGVSYSQYWNWQLLSIINVFVAVFLAVTGIGCFLNQESTVERAESNGN